MSDNKNFYHIDFSNSYGISPPGNDDVSELLPFFKNLDITMSHQTAEKKIESANLKEIISAHNHHHTLPKDDFVQDHADVVLNRDQELLNAAFTPLIEVIQQLNVQMNARFEQLNNQLTQLKSITQESRNEARQSAIELSIKTAQERNILNRDILGRPADTICFFSGEDPIELGLHPLGTVVDIDALSAEEIDRYCAGYGLARPVFANGQWSGCRAQKESLRSFLCILSTPDLE